MTKILPIKSTLLIVDDRPENLLALEVVLKKDYHLIYATCGQEALELIKKNEIDVVLLDIQMPVMDGYEVGAVDYFTKPFDPGILKLKIAIYASFRQ